MYSHVNPVVVVCYTRRSCSTFFSFSFGCVWTDRSRSDWCRVFASLMDVARYCWILPYHRGFPTANQSPTLECRGSRYHCCMSVECKRAISSVRPACHTREHTRLNRGGYGSHVVMYSDPGCRVECCDALSSLTSPTERFCKTCTCNYRISKVFALLVPAVEAVYIAVPPPPPVCAQCLRRRSIVERPVAWGHLVCHRIHGPHL